MIVVTSTAKNAVGLAGRCVESVFAQHPTACHMYSAVDEETAMDAMRPGVCVQVSPAASLVNLIKMWQVLPPDDVVVWLDGDDALTPGALERVEHYYQRSDVWLTYGSFVRDDGMLDHFWNPCFGRRHGEAGPRVERWRASHLRTFRAGLVQQVIARRQLISARTGVPFEYSTDLAVMIPMLELAGENYLAVTDVLCRYTFNAAAHRSRDAEERAVRDELVGRKPLEPLHSRPW